MFESMAPPRNDGADSVIAKEIAVKKYVVKLSTEERERLDGLIRNGKHPARKLTRARILLKADAGEAAKDGATARSPRRWAPGLRQSPAFVSNWSKKGSSPC
jgi:hypothetical protein